MSEATEARYLRVNFTNGTQRSFAYAPIEEDGTFTTRVTEMLKSSQLMLQFDDRVEIFPWANIQSVEVAPKPNLNLPHAVDVLYEFTD